MIVVGLSGKLRAGKDAFAARLVEAWGFTIVRFSDALKEELLERMPLTLRALQSLQGGGTCGCHRYTSISGTAAGIVRAQEEARAACLRTMLYDTKPPGFRELLQEYGTQVRRADDPDYWTKQWAKRAARFERVVAPDVRFPNEAEAVQSRGGELWRIERPGLPVGTHESETVMDAWPRFEAFIQNDGTLAELHAKADALMAGIAQATA